MSGLQQVHKRTGGSRMKPGRQQTTRKYGLLWMFLSTAAATQGDQPAAEDCFHG